MAATASGRDRRRDASWTEKRAEQPLGGPRVPVSRGQARRAVATLKDMKLMELSWILADTVGTLVSMQARLDEAGLAVAADATQVAVRLAAIAPHLSRLVDGRKCVRSDKLRRDVALHAEDIGPGACLLTANVNELRRHEKGPRFAVEAAAEGSARKRLATDGKAAAEEADRLADEKIAEVKKEKEAAIKAAAQATRFAVEAAAKEAARIAEEQRVAAVKVRFNARRAMKSRLQRLKRQIS